MSIDFIQWAIIGLVWVMGIATYARQPARSRRR